MLNTPPWTLLISAWFYTLFNSWTSWSTCVLSSFLTKMFYMYYQSILSLNLQPFKRKATLLLPYRHARFTPPGAKYLILDDFHFCIDPQIINYNGLSFHTSMGLPELELEGLGLYLSVLPFRIYTVELINFVCFTFRTSPLKFFFFS
jgi:hypothetical protein